MKNFTSFCQAEFTRHVSTAYIGADTVRFKAEVNFDGREVARAHIQTLSMEDILKVRSYERAKK